MEDEALNPELVVSADGSHTLKVESLKEHYHSHNGALQESEYVFIQMGLHQFPKDATVSIFEMGFGTGLNVLVTALRGENRKIEMTTIESRPLPLELISQLNYPECTEDKASRSIFERIHQLPWTDWQELTPNFRLKKVQTSLELFETDQRFDLVYYDAFAPHAQPELWTPNIWSKLFILMSENAVLVTYCAKGQVRRDLEAAGFKVERLPGPPGKREMLRVKKIGIKP